jgi:branched-chain amino acid transport system substrate-binding protein
MTLPRSQSRHLTPSPSPSPRRRSKLPLLLALVALGGGVLYHRLGAKSPGNSSPSRSSALASPPNTPEIPLSYRISLGEEVLLETDQTREKQAGAEAIATRQYSTAIANLTASLKIQRNDPEALIYLNNAKAAATNQTLRLGVSVPIGKNPDVAKEILRGVAQAQDEVNRQGGINGKLLEILIANDDNDMAIAPQIARAFIEDPDLLAVVGHNASNASVAAAPIYQANGVVMISPTSGTTKLSSIGNYIFRTTISNRLSADVLADYAVKVAGKTRFLICIDSTTEQGISMKREFTTALLFAKSGSLVNVKCDFKDPQFNAKAIVNQAIQAGAEGVLMVPAINSAASFEPTIAIAKASQGKLLLLGNESLYTNIILKQGGAEMLGLVLPVTWHPAAAQTAFHGNAIALWGGEVNWRTANAYDATQAIVQGLRQNPTREGIQHVLSRANFTAQGAAGNVQFLPTGDRDSRNLLVRVEAGKTPQEAYQFVPIRP